jgi:hypothetical protein
MIVLLSVAVVWLKPEPRVRHSGTHSARRSCFGRAGRRYPQLHGLPGVDGQTLPTSTGVWLELTRFRGHLILA